MALLNEELFQERHAKQLLKILTDPETLVYEADAAGIVMQFGQESYRFSQFLVWEDINTILDRKPSPEDLQAVAIKNAIKLLERKGYTVQTGGIKRRAKRTKNE